MRLKPKALPEATLSSVTCRDFHVGLFNHHFRTARLVPLGIRNSRPVAFQQSCLQFGQRIKSTPEACKQWNSYPDRLGRTGVFSDATPCTQPLNAQCLLQVYHTMYINTPKTTHFTLRIPTVLEINNSMITTLY
jgi:hypothetical protein